MFKSNRPKLNPFTCSATLLAAMPVVVAALLAQLNQDNFRWCSEGIKKCSTSKIGNIGI